MNNEKMFTVLFFASVVFISLAVALGVISGDIVLPIPFWVFVNWLSVAIGFPLIPIFGKSDLKGQKGFIVAFLLFSSAPIIAYQVLLFSFGYYS